MSLNDRTNETIPLSIERSTLDVDIDSDSSFDPSVWAWLSFDDEHEHSYKLTLDETEKLHDRLGRILGKVAAA